MQSNKSKIFRSTFSNLNLLTFNSHSESINQREIHISGKYVTLCQSQLGKLETERMWQGIVSLSHGMKDIPFKTNILPLDIYCAGCGCEILPFVHGLFLLFTFSFFCVLLLKFTSHHSSLLLKKKIKIPRHFLSDTFLRAVLVALISPPLILLKFHTKPSHCSAFV